MRLARPPTGFIIVEPAGIRQLVQSHAATWPAFPRRWAAIKARLAMTGHREGEPFRGDHKRLVFKDAADPFIPMPRVIVEYAINGEHLVIRKLVAVL